MTVTRVEQLPYSVAGFGDTLAHDYAHGVPAARLFFPVERWEDAVAQIDARTYPREQLSAILEQYAKTANAPAAALENIRLLREPCTYAIVTGQQAGLLGGPLLTLHKALTAIKLARKLQQDSNGRLKFVPVFWVAGDDHDLAEIAETSLLDEGGELVRLRAEYTPESAGCSACDARVAPAALQTLGAELQHVQPELASDFSTRYGSLDMADSFGRLLYRWLGALGLVVVQSADVRAFGRELFKRELNEYDITSRLVAEAALRLQRQSYEPGLSNKQIAPHLFISTEPLRIRANLDPVATKSGVTFHERSAVFAERGCTPQEYSPAQLAKLIDAQPQRFSPSAALRPVLQQLVFPAPIVVLGPGEMSYWAQLKGVYEHFNAVWPMIVPRASLTLIDQKTEQTMRKTGLSTADILTDHDALKKKLFAGSELTQRLQARSAAILSELNQMDAEVFAVDRGLRPMFEKVRGRVQHELERIVERTQASMEQHENAGVDRLRALSNLVRPRNSPQERVLNCGQFLARYPALPTELLEAIDPDLRQHRVLFL